MVIAPREVITHFTTGTHHEVRVRAQRLGVVALFLVDLLIVTVTAVAALAIRDWWRTTNIVDWRMPGEIESTLANPYLLATALWLVTLAAAGCYGSANTGAGTREYSKVANASLVAAGLIGIACYLARFPMSRGFFVLMFGLGIPALVLGRYVLRKTTQALHRRGHLLNRVIVAGDAEHIGEVAAVLNREKWLGYEVVGALLPQAKGEFSAAGVPVLGSVRNAVAAVRTHDVDAVIFADGSFSNSREFRRMAWQLEDQNAHMIVVPSLTDVSAERIETRPVGGLPFVTVERPQAQEAGRLGKRLFDIIGSGFIMACALPVIAVVALLVKLEDGGPVIFKQVRVGRNGQFFHCLKLRSMRVDAEEIKKQLISDDGENVLFKMKDDPRVTRIGKFIRRYSLDELPQLWNVFRGDMSLIGPRPHLPNEVNSYDQDVVRRLSVRPGMTGLWQVSGRSDLPWDEAVRLDLYYVDNWSMLQDLTILSRTVKAVVGPSGAY